MDIMAELERTRELERNRRHRMPMREEIMDEKAELERVLNDRQKRFVLEYLKNGNNGTEAAIKAGYAPRSAHVQASRMLKDDKVQAYRRVCVRELYKQLGLTPEQIGLEIWGVYQKCLEGTPHVVWDRDLRDYVPDGTFNFDSRGALKALELLAKQNGALTERVEISAPEQPMSLARMLEAAREVLADADGDGGKASSGAAEDK